MSLVFYGESFSSRLLLGTAQYPSPQIMKSAIEVSGCEILTASVRREAAKGRDGQKFWSLIQQTGCRILPNTAGCKSVQEAVTTAHMARELFDTPWIKLEVIGNDDTLQPNVFGLVEAAKILCEEGFNVFPYTTTDLGVAEKLVDFGCQVLMPWGSPIGSGRGLNDLYALRSFRAHFPDISLVIDAGIGTASHATQALELGYDAVLLNTAVAKAGDSVAMAEAFKYALFAGRKAFEAKAINPRDMAMPSTPVVGTPFWHTHD
ncbi:thiazole synthase [Alteromonadaceae bacterium M269]|nr:thiazole synthase [Alteromonadaceae bacterium M269]